MITSLYRHHHDKFLTFTCWVFLKYCQTYLVGKKGQLNLRITILKLCVFLFFLFYSTRNSLEIVHEDSAFPPLKKSSLKISKRRP